MSTVYVIDSDHQFKVTCPIAQLLTMHFEHFQKNGNILVFDQKIDIFEFLCSIKVTYGFIAKARKKIDRIYLLKTIYISNDYLAEGYT